MLSYTTFRCPLPPLLLSPSFAPASLSFYSLFENDRDLLHEKEEEEEEEEEVGEGGREGEKGPLKE